MFKSKNFKSLSVYKPLPHEMGLNDSSKTKKNEGENQIV